MILEFLRDGAWQAIGTILAVFVAIFIYYLQSQRKELAFGILSSQELLTVSQEIAQRVQITFDSIAIKQLHLVNIGIKNSGDKPILKEDFSRNFEIDINGKGKVLLAETIKQFPTYLEVNIIATDSKIEINPLLLNSGEYLVIKVLYAGTAPKVTCSPRIAGISKIADLNKGVRLGPKEILGFTSTTITIIFILAFFYFASLFSKKISDEIHIIGIGFLSIWFFALTMFGLEWLRGHFSNSRRRYIDTI